MRNNYPIHRGLVSLLVLVLLSALTFQSQAQSGSVTTTQSFSYTGEIVIYTVPTGVTSLTIEARGAEGGFGDRQFGGNFPIYAAGRGALIRGTVSVTSGQTLKILVGQKSTNRNGGGGGSFVTTNTNDPLIIAGGGGGSGTDSDLATKDGQAGRTGGANGGSNGNGGPAINGASAGGGGLLTDGGNSNFPNGPSEQSRGGKAFVNGGAGSSNNGSFGLGGFGGGGSGTGTASGGGGGGYSGGGGNNGPGGGGGSFNAGTNPTNTAGANLGNGLVTITYAVPPQPIRYVRPVASGTGDGSSWANASGDLQSQIDIAGAQQVWVAGGRYTTTANGGSFSLKNGVAVYGGFAGSENSLTDRPAINSVNGQPSSTTLTTASRSAVINTRDLDNTARLDGVVITGGNNNFGGGIYNSNSSPVLTNCTISGNTATQLGGGLFNTRSSPVLTNCLISGNSVSNLGGGIYNDSSSPVLTNCFIRSNTASRQGGGLFNNSSSSPSLTNCTISGNTASDQGGGILNKANSSPVLTNCLLANNTATNQGGAIHNFDGSNPRLVNCTLSGNSAGDQGGAISEDGTTSQLTNAILFNNGGAKAFRFINNGSTSLTYSLIEQGATGYTSGPGNLTATVSPFVSGTDFTLSTCSVAINAGDPASTTATSGATDLLGNPRFYQNGRIDMGAYEFQGTPAQSVAITQQPFSGSSVTAGASVSVPVSVSGTVSGYQWYKDNLSSPVTGQTSATLTLTNVQTSDAGSYSLVVTGACNSVTSTAFSLSVSPAQPIRYVKQGGTGDGSSWANASGDLQSQINIAGAQQVWVAQGIYTPGPANNTDRTISFVMKESVAIYGGFVGSESSLSARPAVNPTTGSPSSSTLSGDIGTVGTNTDNSRQVVISDGLTASAHLDGFVISGAYNPDGTGASRVGGGMYNRNSSPTLANLRFSQNQAQFGGAMFNEVSNPALNNCDLSQNQSSNKGGGFYNDRSSPVLTNCLISGNSGPARGGAFYNDSSNPVLTNCLISGNSAVNLGGGIINFNSSPRLVNCTLTGNRAGAGAALINYAASQPVLTNTILWDNQESAGTAINNDSGTGVTANYCLIGQGEADFTGSNNLVATTSPFVSGTDFTLSTCSVAINAGDPASTTAISGATDLLGNPRFYQNGRIDMGAYEFQGTPNSAVAITQQPVSGSSVCAGSTVTAIVSVTGTSPAYQWYKGSALVSGQTSPTLTLSNVQPGDAGSYAVVVTGSCNSVTSTAFSLSVNPPPTASLSASPSATLSCAQTSLTLTAGGGNTGETLSYVFSPNVVSQSGNMAVVNTSGTYSVTVTNTASGCFSTTYISISQDNIAPMASLASSGTLTCAVTSVTLTASPNGQTYVFGPGASPIGSSNQATVSSPGMYSVTVISANGCSGVGSVSVSQDITPPVATISGNLTLTSGSSTTLTASGGTSQTWSTGEITPSIVVMAGTYSVTVTNASGCSSTTSVTVSLAFGSGAITVLHQDVSFGQTTTNTILPYLQLANSGSAPIAYSTITVRYWLTVEGNSPITNFQHYYVQIGAANVHEQYVPLATPRQGATAYVEYSFDGAAGSLVGGTNSGPIQNGFSKADYSAFNQSDDYSYVANRDYTANARITAYVNGFLVYGQEPSDLGPVPPLILSLSANPTMLTTSGTTTLSAMVSGGTTGVPDRSYSYSFTGPGTITPSGNTASVSGIPAGVQTYTVVARDATSPTSQTISATVSVTVTQAPTNTAPMATANNNQTATVGVAFAYMVNAFTDAETPNGLTYSASISPANGLSFDPATRILSGTPSMSGVSSVTVTATDPSSLSASTTFSITVSPAPVVVGNTQLTVLHQDVSFGQTTTNTILPYLQLVNSGSAPIPYSAITVRYWLTVEGNSPITNFQNYYVQIGGNNVHARYVPLATPRQGATAYVEYSFDGAAGSLVGGSNSGPIQNGFSKADYSAFNQSDDYSYVANRDYTANARITAYVNGVLVYGQEPPVGARVGAIESKETLRVQVLGNPVVNEVVEVMVSGGGGHSLLYQLTDARGRVVGEQRVDQAGSPDHQRLSVVGQSAGVLLLRVSTPTQSQTVKLLRAE